MYEGASYLVDGNWQGDGPCYDHPWPSHPTFHQPSLRSYAPHEPHWWFSQGTTPGHGYQQQSQNSATWMNPYQHHPTRLTQTFPNPALPMLHSADMMQQPRWATAPPMPTYQLLPSVQQSSAVAPPAPLILYQLVSPYESRPMRMQLQGQTNNLPPSKDCSSPWTTSAASWKSGQPCRSITRRRGPPRKPKRSGHAIWVGNIPSSVSIEALKDHLSRSFTSEIESVFLMSRSNCAFVNYRTRKACVAAVELFNQSLFGPVRLLCRLRQEPGVLSPTLEQGPPTPAATDSTSSDILTPSDSLDATTHALAAVDLDDAKGEALSTETTNLSSPCRQTRATADDRFFILKSMTKEDIHESLRTGVWETQTHNERPLAEAFESASNVYLMFSVNKSGQYFGYARMCSSPLDSLPSECETSPPSADQSTSEHLRSTMSPATETAPRGYIIDDPTRGTLFWEAAETNTIVSSTTTTTTVTSDVGVSGKEARTRPFRIVWLSTRKVPFQRAKGLRNSWNGNKEVKVARDGTELETEIGTKVLRLFHDEVVVK
ncbi:YT521-B-like splicing factor [Lecanosticta acicola]|uniref:YT521-B-like splicing factor n=1 Tax=Lecanosticta acicola TaxID=111012 RepID=A0AAI9EDP9_9PEZI|nr:YT521-B-like splicing factor [Lecanosticta acicola]